MSFKPHPTRTRFVLFFVGVGLALVCIAIAGAAMATADGLVWNSTPSLPVGYYSPDWNGPLVSFCPTAEAAAIANQRRYRPPGDCPDGFAPLLKPVVARAGDTVTVSVDGISVNGKLIPNSRQFPFDANHRPLPLVPKGTYTVAPHTVWVISSYNNASFDSRYYGAIPVKDIRAHLRPLLTF